MGLFNDATTVELEGSVAPSPTQQASPSVGLTVFGRSVFSSATTQF